MAVAAPGHQSLICQFPSSFEFFIYCIHQIKSAIITSIAIPSVEITCVIITYVITISGHYYIFLCGLCACL